ncbi:MAG: DUF72 domain-containing protein [Spirochaetales bacterium]|nr:DUF72 domain-containing protein [Spirochaetales bacterium]
MKNVFVGTSGYSYKDWAGIFYPEQLKAQDYLAYYASQFAFVELNFSYYTQPAAATMERMAEKAPRDFQFSIKAHQSITHKADPRPEENVRVFLDGVRPLAERGMLAAILLQYPYSFHYTGESRLQLAKTCDLFHDYPVCIEFRNNEWMKPSVYEELKARKIPLVMTDMPALAGLPHYFSLENPAPLTGDFLYLRFHGRNSAHWWTGDNASRYDYLYSEGELNPWVEIIKKLINEVKKTLVAFNNHLKGQAVRNAREISELLKKAKIG